MTTEKPQVIKYLKDINVTEFISGIPLIDCIYVINLDHRTDKWDRLTKIFDQLNIKVNRVSAFLGKNLTYKDKEILTGSLLTALSPPEMGCILSHLSILKDALSRGFERILVWEDDLVFLEPLELFPKLIKDLTAIDPNWDILYTDVNCRQPESGYYTSYELAPRDGVITTSLESLKKRIEISPELDRINIRYGSTSMILSKSGMKKILEHFLEFYFWVPYDWDIHYIKGIREYCPKIDIVSNLRNGFQSDIR